MTHLRDLNRAKSYQQGVEEERKRCVEICRDTEAKYRADHRDASRLGPNSYGAGAAYGSYDTADEIRRAILGEDE